MCCKNARRQAAPRNATERFEVLFCIVPLHSRLLRLFPTEQCLRDGVITRLGHTTTKERQCKKHHAYKIKHSPVYNTPDPLLCNARTPRGNPQQFSQLPFQKSVYKNSFFPATIVHWNRLPQHKVEQPTLEGFQSALGQRKAIN